MLTSELPAFRRANISPRLAVFDRRLKKSTPVGEPLPATPVHKNSQHFATWKADYDSGNLLNLATVRGTATDVPVTPPPAPVKPRKVTEVLTHSRPVKVNRGITYVSSQI